MPHLEELLAHDRDAAVLQGGLTTSTSTDLVLESLLTGLGAHRPNHALGTAPTLWAWAEAAGHDAWLVTPQTLAWGPLTDRLELSAAGRVFSRRDAPDAPLANDLGIDELLAADHLAAKIRDQPDDRPFVAVYLSNALHVPGQRTSERMPVPEGPPYRQSLAIADEAGHRLVQALGDRRDRTLIVWLGDHGTTRDRSHALPRLYGMYEPFVRIPVAVQLPATLQADRPDALASLRAHRERTVTTPDVFVTALDALGVPPDQAEATAGVPLDGRSLLRPPPAEERTVFTTNANEARRFHHEGFVAARGDWRLLFTDLEGMALYDVATDPDQRVDRLAHAPEQGATLVRAIRAQPVLRDILRRQGWQALPDPIARPAQRAAAPSAR